MPVDIPSGAPAAIATPTAGDIRLARLSLNQWTTRHWSLPDLVAGLGRAGIGHVGLWREPVQAYGIAESAALVQRAGLHVSSLCRGGFLTGDDSVQAHADNVAAIEEAAELEADCLVLVVGGMDRADQPRLDVAEARKRVADRLAELVPVAHRHGVRLALEPLHPMYCADRAVLSTLGQAIDLAEPFPSEDVGVVVDTFHVWWDPDLERQIRRAGDRIASYQLAEWVLPLQQDVLLSRGMMGDGYADFASITRWVSDAGYDGPVEVEIFNEAVWQADPVEVVETVARRYVQHVQPSLS
ncbi:sugar phosphate isomerase/epimerase family protein [Luteipulveratus mongoliensis]|uniref:Xylose isomerase n=1 Tax=Luteipulveratus mongoliensis TaxID=571913 RepID=A0A0K1JG96_9MICO|nr:sugar phosphate isomerase/epimerase [Luteipulveratus mongoliensis]AKU15630.1 xylose isomerase [Luteipulveratus mongoliensis]